jgi:hypothetical protein
MRKSVAVALVLAFAGISLAGIHEGSKRRMEWCKQNWEQCKQKKLERLSVKRECLEKSQSFEDYKGCITQFRKQRAQ